MKTIPIDQIIITNNRQRQEFLDEPLIELASSIRKVGLLQPLVLRNDGRTLVSGERRLRAIRDYIYALRFSFQHQGVVFENPFIPFVILGELDPIALEEAEFDENFKRRDPTWQEKSAAISRLHALRQKLNPCHSVADTALEVRGRADGANHDVIRKALLLAKHLGNPSVANAKSADEAFKILKKQEEASEHAALAAAIGQTFSAKDHEAYQTDCLTWMQGYMGEGFDCIIADPPYGMGADQFGDGAGKLIGIEHEYDDSKSSWLQLMGGSPPVLQDWTQWIFEHPGWCHLAYKVTKPQAHAYIFCDLDNFHELKFMMETAGWYVFRTPLVYQKLNSGRVPLPEHGPRRSYELLLYAIKGWKTVTHIAPDVLSFKADEQMGHGAQKPVSVYKELLVRSCRPGDHVLDPFAGSGTIFPAAHDLKLRATGIEKDPVYFGKCLQRLKELI